MLLLSLALAAQGYTLETSTREAALSCGAAVTLVDTQPSLGRLVTKAWFSFTAAKEGNPPAAMFDAALSELPLMNARGDKIGDKAADVLAQCRKRFPRAWDTRAAILPANDYDRRAVCFVVGTLMAAYMDRDDPARAARIRAQFGALVSNEELDGRGVNNAAAFSTEAGRIVGLTLPLGNFQGVLTACEAAFKG